jgi:nitroreductase
LVAYSFGQEQVKDASHLFVLCREKNLTPDHFEAHIQDISNTREIPVEELEQRKNYLSDSILSKNNTDQQVWMEKQIYIALGNLLSACAIMGIDSCPMEGFIPKEYDRILDLESHNLTSVLAIPVGYRSAEDTYALQKKVRRSTDNFLVKI